MDNQLPKPLIITISLIQGILLTLLYQSVEHKIWPSTEPIWLISLVTVSISFPLLTLLSITKTNSKATVKYLLPFTLLLSVLGAYVGYQQEPIEFVNNGSVIGIFCFTALIAAFKALMYIQQYLSHEEISYSSLFKLSWRNFIIFGECWLFVLIFWGILHLGAGLFSVLEIEFFKELLRKDWFVIPVLNLAFGFAIIVFRNIIFTVDNISTILQTLIKFLLPALTIVSLGFLATLPFTGLDTLWKTGTGSLLVMWLQALTLFFVNAVYQDASHERPYHNILHRLIFIGVGVLPIYSLISFYGLWLRIDQYGLTVDRCWAVLICVLLACFSFGYLIGIIKKRDAWLETLSKVNISMGIVVLVSMLLVNSPLLNFQSISASSQLSRLHDSEITYDEFDYQYFDRSLGRQGYIELQKLKTELKDSAPEKIAIIDRMYVNHQNIAKDELSLEDFLQFVNYWPSKNEFPENLIEAVYSEETKNEWTTYRGNNYYFIAKDLNEDGELDYIVIEENNHSTSADLWFLKDEQWKSKYMQTSNPNDNRLIKDYLLNNEVEAVKPKWKNLKVGDLTFRTSLD
ncbi:MULTISPECIES: DUF4153 domain-containing protein [unclassified Colwellia]|jgi:hypothetical protein|uniref:DUF4153 domain-containing protein n=1 Tax=unclassified Colwellia TaxID=196834 RepID=UPI0015F5AD50|nr:MULTISPECIES: DUF4153 domain-containing protein [unclassified Colwellia]MBA6231774.1 DUF4153 domain-containing protein [Colwellia sp. MB02u-7]MBA6235729.1 DUF4153 domain-containing protein [Colwellia sp. MB02u-11]MBA6257510.1 DUF4153 domain-containing protein [Colwellia sp. MB3u-28]MBA6260582.1 DUF4153 domain-containing protein [Colwellia sp. MB3u-41]MBA6298818.1 DUF4153 domain-containing protein [Colwellia sp. MB3u-22]